MFDLTIFPLFLVGGREQYELPGLFVTAAPRKAARMRAQDMLVLFLRINLPSGAISSVLTGAQQQEILSKLSETYFETSGSVTAGLRAVSNRLNDFMINRNLKGGPEGQMVGTLNLAALHGETLMVAHTGPAHSFVLTKTQVQHYDDSPLTREGTGGRGLGLARQVMPRFYQTVMEADDLLVFCSDPPPTWTTKALSGSPGLTLDTLRRRLVSEMVNDLQAVVIRTQAGKGKISYWRPQERPASAEGRAQPTGTRTATTSASDAPQPPAITSPSKNSTVRFNVPSSPVPAPIAPQTPTSTSQPPITETPVTPMPELSEAKHLAPSSHEPAKTYPADSLPAVVYEMGQAPNAETAVSSPMDQVQGNELAADSLAQEADTADAQADREPVSGALIFIAIDLEQPVEPEDLPSEAVILRGTIDSAAVEPTSRPTIRATSPAAEGQSASIPIGSAARPFRVRSNGKPVTSRKPAPQWKGLLGWFGNRTQAKTAAGSRIPVAASQVSGQSASAPKSVRTAKPVGKSASSVSLAPLPSPRSESLRRGLTSIFHKGRTAREKVGGAIFTTASRVVPGQTLSSLPQAWLLLLAIAVPLIVVAVATTVYVRAGRSEQFDLLVAQARQYGQQAGQLTNPLQQKEAWTRAYDLSDQAITRYNHGDQAALDLRQQALIKLDEMDGIIRLDYQPLRDGLGPDVKITKMVSTLTGVYMLDSSQGRIFRLQPSTTGFTVDPQFNCGPGKAGSSIITQLIDIAPLPINNQLKADILALDSGGNLVYCSANLEGFDSKSLPLPDNGWGKLTAMTTLGDALFVLDPQGNAVYRYDGDSGMFITGPHLYFDTDIPRMSDVIDLDVDQEFLYLLHADGEMTVCDSGGVSFVPVKCTDPTPYGDWRIGYDPSPLTFPGTHLSNIQATQPPAASLFALDESNRAIYHLSLRKLNLQFQYRPKIESDFPLPNTPPTGYVITLNRRVLIAFGNRIYYAQIP